MSSTPITARRANLLSRIVLCVAALAAVIAVTVGAQATSEAQSSQGSCPTDMVIAADGVSCISASVDENITVTTSCVQGVLSADGQTCVVPRIDQPEPAAPATQPAPAPAVATTGSTVVFTG